MNNILIKYFEIIWFILWIIIWLSVNWITDFYKVNIYFSVPILIITIIWFIYWLITKNKIISFDYNIEKWKWKKELIYNNEIWICENNPMFQIKKWDNYWDFSESWTQVYPDKNWSWKYSIELLINWVIIKTLYWIYCDWHKISVPLPKIENINDSEIVYFWNKNSIEFKVAKIIWEFHIYKNIEWVANISKIEIR